MTGDTLLVIKKPLHRKMMLWLCLIILLFNCTVHCSPSRKRPRISESYDPDHYDHNPPDILRALEDQDYLQGLPEKFQAFFGVFEPCWTAHIYGLRIRVSLKGLELFEWNHNPIIEALDAKIHLAFVRSLIMSLDYLNTETSELFQEYTRYIFDKFNGSIIPNDTLIDLIRASIKLNEPELFYAWIEYLPIDSSDSFFSVVNQLYIELLATPTSSKHDFKLNSSESVNTRKWIGIFCRFCRVFGPLRIDSFGVSGVVMLVKSLQPVLATIAQRDSARFLVETSLLRAVNLRQISFWVGNFLERDEWIKFPLKADFEKLKSLADVMFTYFLKISEMNIQNLMIFFLSNNYCALPQFFALYSKQFRKALSQKWERLVLLESLLYKTENFDLVPLIPFVVAFGFTSRDLDGHFKGTGKESTRSTSLTYCLQVAESAPETFEFPWTWRIPFVLLNSPVDSKTPVIFNAGRIVLARYFGIPPSATYLSISREEACFYDLSWFLEIFLKLHRPDLSPNFSVQVTEDCVQITATAAVVVVVVVGSGGDESKE